MRNWQIYLKHNYRWVDCWSNEIQIMLLKCFFSENLENLQTDINKLLSQNYFHNMEDYKQFTAKKLHVMY